MIINKSQLRDNYDVVIIGAGIAGLALSRFLNLNKNILLVESGDFKFNKSINESSFAKSKNIGNWPTENYASYYSRVRMFGGNANVWGGWCMELDEYDYSHNTIWNMLKKDLEIHYKRAYEILNINPQEIDSNELNMKRIKPYSINITRGNYIKESKEYLEKSLNIDVLIQTELTKINFNEKKVHSIYLEDHDKDKFEIKLNKLIISTGGIETTKLLLSSLPPSLINLNLGKYFMEHPQIQVGRVFIKNSLVNNFLKKYSPPTAKHLFDDRLDVKQPKYFSGFKSTDQNVRNYFVLRTSNVYQSKALYRLRHIILTRNLNSVGHIKFKDLINLVIDVSDMFLVKIKSLLVKKKSYSVVLHLEQKPNELNQVYLDAENNIVLDWNFLKDDLENLKNSIEDLNIIFEELDSDFQLDNIFSANDQELTSYLEKNIFGIGHHMGTTSMGLNAKDSVCDTNLNYHGIDNLIINSSSVFPSGGIANPTLTMLALTSRLAERLNNE